MDKVVLIGWCRSVHEGLSRCLWLLSGQKLGSIDHHLGQGGAHSATSVFMALSLLCTLGNPHPHPISVLSTLGPSYCLSYFSNAVKRLRDQDHLKQEASNWGLAYSFRPSWWEGSMVAGMHDPRAVAESLHLILRQEAEREREK